MSIAQLFLDTLELRAGSVITEREISAIKKRWTARTAGAPYTEYESMQQYAPYQVSDEQAIKGIDWWHARVFNKAGNVRNTAFTRANVMSDPRVLHILNNATHYVLSDWEWLGNTWQRPYPIYRLIANDGQWFEYTAIPWQAGRRADDCIVHAIGRG